MNIHQLLRSGSLSVWIRYGLTVAATVASTAFVQSETVANALRRPLMESVGIDTSPLLIFGLLLCLFAWSLIRDDPEKKPLRWPSFEQAFTALLLWATIVVFAVWLTHPTQEFFVRIQVYALRNPETGPPMVAAFLSVIELLPALPLLLLAFPIAAIRQSRGRVIAGTLLLLVYALGPVLEASYYRLTGPPLVAAVRGVLSLLPGTTPMNLTQWEIGYQQFSVTLGYACTDFSALMLFIGLFGIVWWRMTMKHSVVHRRAIGALLGGIVSLWILNVLRVTMIVIIGSRYPTFALSLFHSGIGIVIFLCF
ncbi:MAG: exosortase/archaeosortase family protein, partial [Candidatus Peribacteraceae bacterium]|nr:exosortase/archaeosortase family protein [Candidatus Peribacteraceae bacterium]